jgi:hypothetical protein
VEEIPQNKRRNQQVFQVGMKYENTLRFFGEFESTKTIRKGGIK